MPDRRSRARRAIDVRLLFAASFAVFLLATAAFAAASITGPPAIARALAGLGGLALLGLSVWFFRAAWRLARPPRAGPGRSTRGGGVPRAEAPVPVRSRIARLAMLPTDDPRVVGSYLALAGPPIVAGVTLLGTVLVGAGLRAAGTTVRLGWAPVWLVVLLQVTSLAGVVAMGVAAHRDRQVRIAALCAPLVLLGVAAMLCRDLTVPVVVAAIGVVLALVMRVLGWPARARGVR